jgi:FAD/FMN-containing dehydrogenase
VGKGASLVFPAHMSKILELDTKIKKIRVQSGISARELQEVLATHGLALPIYPTNSKFTTVAGEIANNTGGAKGVKYGAIGDYVDRLEVVLSNGEVIQTGRLSRSELSRKQGLANLEGEIYRELDALIEENYSVIERLSSDLRSSVGYNLFDVKRRDGSFDLTPLLVGSQGTLAIFSQAILRLEQKPPANALLLAVFSSLDNLADIVAAVKSTNPTQVDFIDGEVLSWIQRQTGINPLNTLEVKDPAGILVIELDDGDGTHSKNARKLAKLLEKVGAVVQLAETVDDKEDIWSLSNSLNLLYDLADEPRRVVSFADSIVPLKNIEKFYHVIKKLIRARKITGFVSGRIGEGNLAITALLDLNKVGDRQAAFGTARDLYSLAGRLGGEIAGDSGDGRLRQQAARGQYDDAALGVFEKVKTIFDPKNILNPGVIIGADDKELISRLSTQPAKRFLDYRPRV